MIKHFRLWNIWRKLHPSFPTRYKLGVLFGLKKSAYLDLMKENYEEPVLSDRSKDILAMVVAAIAAVIIGLLMGCIMLLLLNAAIYPSRAVEVINEPVVAAEEPMVVDEVIEPIPEPPIEKNVTYFDVPLSEDLQDHIFEVCEERDIDPAVVVAIIEKESVFNSSAIGDRGRSFGLMQIQPRWHYGRMESLGCTDLLNPYQNITVGVDYIAELFESGKSLEWVLMAYNGGCSYANKKASRGEISGYVTRVLSIIDGYNR